MPLNKETQTETVLRVCVDPMYISLHFATFDYVDYIFEL